MDIKTLNQILEIAFAKRVSDVHFEVDNPPFFRAHGQLLRSKLPSLKPADTEFIASTIMTHNGRNLPESFKEFDASYSLSNNGRFRASIFKQRGNTGIVMRVIPPEIGGFQDLKLPTVLTEIVKAPNGLVLVTGPTGHGKSTTLASMINYINNKYAYN
ncbi:MAG: twitching motility protein PilT, partial [Desulfuromonadaceae bacterium]|nr:twitching motility protein PilT [Desulfuromonadaceae bacterium]